MTPDATPLHPDAVNDKARPGALPLWKRLHCSPRIEAPLGGMSTDGVCFFLLLRRHHQSLPVGESVALDNAAPRSRLFFFPSSFLFRSLIQSSCNLPNPSAGTSASGSFLKKPKLNQLPQASLTCTRMSRRNFIGAQNPAKEFCNEKHPWIRTSCAISRLTATVASSMGFPSGIRSRAYLQVNDSDKGTEANRRHKGWA
ncbi:hypothetical protein LX36DRAFT_438101 [Colletotrichum falcatum]|nr:hypothetical protein LX36DRAFT_445420 [Colletotrichum falcatum]KAK1990117.1 hypothetical protein LX36DRAFT_438101 [Colletotrichum falcatum]